MLLRFKSKLCMVGVEHRKWTIPPSIQWHM